MAVHVFTASGAFLGLLALFAAADGDWTAMFWWLGVALLVDAIDGPVARALDVGRRLPRFSGDALDLVVDYLTYVAVPAFALARSGLLGEWGGFVAAALITVSGALYFADGEMKTRDAFFKGFPGVWNAVAFHLFVLAPPPAVGLAVVAALTAATFLPVMFVHPVRVVWMRPVTLGLLAVWAVLAAWALVAGLAPPAAVQWGLALVALYFLGLGFFRPRRPAA